MLIIMKTAHTVERKRRRSRGPWEGSSIDDKSHPRRYGG
jgi:hypothetical protein